MTVTNPKSSDLNEKEPSQVTEEFDDGEDDAVEVDLSGTGAY